MPPPRSSRRKAPSGRTPKRPTNTPNTVQDDPKTPKMPKTTPKRFEDRDSNFEEGAVCGLWDRHRSIQDEQLRCEVAVIAPNGRRRPGFEDDATTTTTMTMTTTTTTTTGDGPQATGDRRQTASPINLYHAGHVRARMSTAHQTMRFPSEDDIETLTHNSFFHEKTLTFHRAFFSGCHRKTHALPTFLSQGRHVVRLRAHVAFVLCTSPCRIIPRRPRASADVEFLLKLFSHRCQLENLKTHMLFNRTSSICQCAFVD